MNLQALIEDHRMFRSHQALSRADRFASFRYIFGDSQEDDSRREAVEPAELYQVDEREAIKEQGLTAGPLFQENVMNVEVIKENLIVNGNLLTGADGKLYATGEISWLWRDGGAEYIKRFNEKTGLRIPDDYDIQGKTVIVLGSVHVLDDIIKEEEKKDWVVSAGCTEEELEKLGLGQLL